MNVNEEHKVVDFITRSSLKQTIDLIQPELQLALTVTVLRLERSILSASAPLKPLRHIKERGLNKVEDF